MNLFKNLQLSQKVLAVFIVLDIFVFLFIAVIFIQNYPRFFLSVVAPGNGGIHGSSDIPYCGDGICNGSEDVCNCVSDCGSPSCEGKECGEEDACGDPCSGFCPENQQCTFVESEESPSGYGYVCTECIPDCSDSETACGDSDGCGGECLGYCSDDYEICEENEYGEYDCVCVSDFGCGPFFINSLYIGMRSKDVRRLQTLLATKSQIYPEGLVTGYFGPLTEKAVQRFQLNYGVVKSKSDPGYGVVGPKTRAKLQEVFKTPS